MNGHASNRQSRSMIRQKLQGAVGLLANLPGMPRFSVRAGSSEIGQIAARKEWFPVLQWGTWRVRNDVSLRRTGDGKTDIRDGLGGQ